MPDAADLRRRIEGRADFVVEDRRIQLPESFEDGQQFRIHLCRRQGPAHSGDADSLDALEAP
jgi:hypothetical protein